MTPRDPRWTAADRAWADAIWGPDNWTTYWDPDTERWAMAHKENPKCPAS